MLQASIARVQRGETLPLEEMAATIDVIMQGQVAETEIASLLLALRAKGEAPSEIAGAATAIRRHMTPIRSSRTNLLDTCGTGGVGSKLFNISTTSAIVVAAAGVPVAKHGNRSLTSKSGSADVLQGLGVNVNATVEVVEHCLNELGLCFCFAPLLHSAMKHVGPVRKKLGVGTIFNLLGPLCNPAGAAFQLMGVARPELRLTMAMALQQLGTRHAVVMSGEGGLGEVTIHGATHVTVVEPNALRELVWRPADFGVADSSLDALFVEGPEESAAIIRDVLAGKPGPARDIILVNAAAALWVAGRDDSLIACKENAARVIDSGAAQDLLARLASLSNRGS